MAEDDQSHPLSSTSPYAVFRDAALKFLDVQISTNDVLDSKIAAAVSVGSAVLPLSFGLSRLSQTPPTYWTERWFLGAVLCYIALLFTAFLASRLRELEYRPNLAVLEGYSDEYDGEALLWWVASEYRASTDANARLLRRKAILSGVVSIAFYLEGLFLSFAALASVR
jgi:hypothetical protein